MPFSPTTTSLNTLNEFKNLSHAITYVSGGATGATGAGISYPVTITAAESNPTITTSGNIISGYYSDVFVGEIAYRTVDDQFITVTTWQAIENAVNNGTLSEIYYYYADTRVNYVYTYTATANGETKAYTITVTNDWTYGRDQLLRYVHPSQVSGIVWINNSGHPVTWNNVNGNTITWNN
jgi:hypothetical protein